jgi:cobalt-zinc-cadmium efflux system membrane fusion protein
MRITHLLLIIFLAAAAFTSCSRSKEKDEASSEHQTAPVSKHIDVSEEARKKSGIELAVAGPAVLRQTMKLNGKINTNEERTAHVSPRFPGIVKAVGKRLGDPVKKGEALAVIESNESLQTYEVKSEIDGTVIEKKITLGEFVDTGRTIFVVADLSTVWIDFSVYRRESEKLHEGAKVFIKAEDAGEKIESTISYISPFGTESTQTTLARAVVPNPKGELRPGLFVEGVAVVGETPVPVSVKAGALQTFEEKPVVFVADAKGFLVREVEVGAQDDENVEIRSGVAANEKYAAENSFALKSQLANSTSTEE